MEPTLKIYVKRQHICMKSPLIHEASVDKPDLNFSSLTIDWQDDAPFTTFYYKTLNHLKLLSQFQHKK